MRHEDLLEGARSLISDIPADYGQYELLNVLEAIINLHKPCEIEDWDNEVWDYCEGCSNSRFFPWKFCPTIQAIEESLKK